MAIAETADIGAGGHMRQLAVEYRKLDDLVPYRPLLDLFGHAEGTDRKRGYNETLGYGALTGGEVDLVTMTLQEIDALQTRMLKHPDNRFNSQRSAAIKSFAPRCAPSERRSSFPRRPCSMSRCRIVAPAICSACVASTNIWQAASRKMR